MAPILKGIVAIAVEDDAILMTHGYFEISAQGCRDVFESPIKSIPRPLPATSDGLVPEGGVPEEYLLDWRERAPEKVLDYITRYVDECLGDGKSIDAIGVSTFGNVMPGTQLVLYAPSQGERTGKSIPIRFREVLADFTANHEKNVKKTRPIVCVDNDATAMTFGESIIDAQRPELFSCIWLGKGVNAGLSTKEIGSWKGFMHPEMGHFLPRFHPDDADFVERVSLEENPTSCAIHRTCLMGIASRRSILNRREHGMADAAITRIVADYIAQLCVAITYITAPGRIAIGGYTLRSGLLDEKAFLAAVRTSFNKLIGGYPKYPQIAPEYVDSFIVPASGRRSSALLGVTEMMKATILAGDAVTEANSPKKQRKTP